MSVTYPGDCGILDGIMEQKKKWGKTSESE